ncbi:hypothetical protein L1887_28809 [Cichorium endivia]|nr:hypothetical protein L1887_28809 [Cichorium endivia]
MNSSADSAYRFPCCLNRPEIGAGPREERYACGQYSFSEVKSFPLEKKKITTVVWVESFPPRQRAYGGE